MSFTVEPFLFLAPGRDVTWSYYVHGTGTALEAYAALAASAYAAPVNNFGGFLRDLKITARLGVSDSLSEVWYEGQITYATAVSAENPGSIAAEPEPTTGTVDPPCRFVGFNLGVTTAPMKQSLANVSNYTIPGETAPDYHGAIGVTDQGVEGCDRLIGTKTFTLEKRLPLNAVTDEWYRTVVEPLHLHVNSEVFRGHPIGSVLFTEAHGSAEGNIMVMQFTFVVEKNVEDQTVDRITGIYKDGHDYIWFRHVTNSNSSVSITRVVSAHVEQLYPAADYGPLRLQLVSGGS